ncbi:MAG: hypothetical protein JXA30_14610 [Deltaproteobacteria bacterium]|nr:hypothetical protein [Deltaproteobacteria bacterium]
MERETILTILQSARGCQKDHAGFKVKEGHQIELYLGKPGNAMVIGDVLSIVLRDGYLEISAKNDALFYVGYDAVHAISDKLNSGSRSSRSGVGFD